MSGRILFVGMETIFGLSECKHGRSEGVTEWNDGTTERSPLEHRQMGVLVWIWKVWKYELKTCEKTGLGNSFLIWIFRDIVLILTHQIDCLEPLSGNNSLTPGFCETIPRKRVPLKKVLAETIPLKTRSIPRHDSCETVSLKRVLAETQSH